MRSDYLAIGSSKVLRLAVLGLVAVIALDQSEASAQDPPCVVDEDGVACRACLDDTAGSSESAVSLICYGRLPAPNTFTLLDTDCRIDANACPTDIAFYNMCLESADAFRSSDTLAEIAESYDLLRRADVVQTCAPDGLPGMMASLREYQTQYGAFDQGQARVYNQCLSEMLADAHGRIRQFADAEPGRVSIGSRAFAAAVDEALQVDLLMGFIGNREIFKLSEEIDTISQFVAADLSFCQ